MSGDSKVVGLNDAAIRKLHQAIQTTVDPDGKEEDQPILCSYCEATHPCAVLVALDTMNVNTASLILRLASSAATESMGPIIDEPYDEELMKEALRVAHQTVPSTFLWWAEVGVNFDPNAEGVTNG